MVKKCKNPPLSSFVHLDIDYFFAQVEELRLGIVDQPLGVQQHMEVASVNYIARSFGLYNRISVAKAKNICPKLVLVRGDNEVNGMQRYRLKSQEVLKCVMRALDEWKTEKGEIDEGEKVEIPRDWIERRVEKASFDDFYIELPSDTKTAEKWVRLLRQSVECSTGLKASAGIARTKLLSMLATKKAKPNGVYRCESAGDEISLLEQAKIKDLCGAGLKGLPKNLRIFFCEILGDQATVMDLKNLIATNEFDMESVLSSEDINCVNHLFQHLCDGSKMSNFSYPRVLSVECSVRRNDTSPASTVGHVAEGYERLAPMLLSRAVQDEKILGMKRKIDKLIVKWKLFPGAKIVRQSQVPWPTEKHWNIQHVDVQPEHQREKQKGFNCNSISKNIAELATCAFKNANEGKPFQVSRVVLVLSYKNENNGRKRADSSVVRKGRSTQKDDTPMRNNNSKQRRITDMFQSKKRARIR